MDNARNTEPRSDKVKKRYCTNISAYVLIFIFISFLGWSFEKIGGYFLYGSTDDRGFISLPLCPIYGFCLIFMAYLLGTPNKPSGILGRKVRPIAKTAAKKDVGARIFCYLLYFIFAAFTATLAELITGYIFKSFGVPLWDYSQRPLNLGGIICLRYSILWGALITLFMGTLWNVVLYGSFKIPPRIRKPLALSLTALISADFLFNCIFSLTTGNRFLFL